MAQHRAFTPRRGRRSLEAGGRGRGFTLVELLISIVLVGILAAVAVVGFGGMFSTTKATACGADRSALNVAVRAYLTVNGVDRIPFDAATGITPGDTLHNSGLTDKVSIMYAVQPDGTLNAITDNPNGCRTDVMAAAATTTSPATTIPATTTTVAPFIHPARNFAAVAGNGQATFTWSPAETSGYGPVTYYQVATVPNRYVSCRVEPPNPLTCTITGLENGTIYRFYLGVGTAQITTSGELLVVRPSATSATVSPSTPMQSPTNVTGVSGPGAHAATISWTAPTSGGDYPIAKYTVIDFTGNPFTTCDVVPPAPLSCTVTGLTPGASYVFRIRAFNSGGDSSIGDGFGAAITG